jgi:hypothetical protein
MRRNCGNGQWSSATVDKTGYYPSRSFSIVERLKVWD